ncbi:hypothetical protein G3A43_08505 [Paraburkholderia aspalathi]|nr:hypothetical protein [Paraburkholderia aspalathi]MBK3780297.1 hypothetical protein [Paraburkholderia aspalathi]
MRLPLFVQLILIGSVGLAGSLLLTGCSEQKLDPTVEAGAPAVLKKVMPDGFLSISLESKSANGHGQYCFSILDSATGKRWNGDYYTSNLADLSTHVGSDKDSEAIEFHADFSNGRWVVASSDVDAHDMDAAQFESKIRQCLAGFAQDYRVHYEGGVTRTSIVEHNLESWTAFMVPAPASGPNAN